MEFCLSEPDKMSFSTVYTVQTHETNSNKEKDWEQFTMHYFLAESEPE